jgi:hypothetical protein
MTIATEVKKLTESKPFYAVAGAGDFAVEKLRELPERLEKLRELPERLEKLQSRRGELRDTAKDLPIKARQYADVINAKAAELYEEFASRGRRVVSQVSGEAALELEEVSVAAEPPIAKPVTKPVTKPIAKPAPKPVAKKSTAPRAKS